MKSRDSRKVGGTPQSLNSSVGGTLSRSNVRNGDVEIDSAAVDILTVTRATPDGRPHVAKAQVLLVVDQYSRRIVDFYVAQVTD
jgi:hypothetical protein